MAKWEKTGFMVGLLFLVLALVVASCAPAKPSAEKSVKIGLSLIMTGPIASTGVMLAESSLGYLNYVNDELGGIEYTDPKTGKTERVKLDIMWQDNGYNVPRGITIHKRQVAAGAMLRIGQSASESEALSEMASRGHVPVMAGQISSLMMRPKPRYITATIPAYSDQCGAIFPWIRDNWKGPQPAKIGVVAIDVPGMRSAMIHLTAERVAKFGVELAGIEWVPAAVTDSTIELTRLKAKAVDYLYILHIVGGTVVIVKDAARLGMKDKVFLSLVGNEETVIRLLGDMVEGIPGALANAAPEEDLPGVRLGHQIIRRYYNHDATSQNYLTWAQGPVAVEGLRLALEKVGYENLTREAVNEGLHSVTNLDVGGIIPPVTVDPDWPLITKHLKITVIQGGKFKVVSDWLECPVVEPRD